MLSACNPDNLSASTGARLPPHRLTPRKTQPLPSPFPRKTQPCPHRSRSKNPPCHFDRSEPTPFLRVRSRERVGSHREKSLFDRSMRTLAVALDSNPIPCHT